MFIIEIKDWPPARIWALLPNSFSIWMTSLIVKHFAYSKLQGFKYLSPKFDSKGLIPVVTTDNKTGEVLMHGYMNSEALKKTIETKIDQILISLLSNKG